MINRSEILQTIAMIDQQHLDIRTITMGISLLDCADTDITRSCTKVYDKICRLAGRLVRTGEDIEAEFGIPIVNKRVSVTPISLVAASCRAEDYVPLALTLDRAAAALGLFLPGHESYTYHITLAYTRIVPQGEKKAALERAVEEMKTYLNAQGAFEVTPPYVAFYDGMLVFSAKRIAR